MHPDSNSGEEPTNEPVEELTNHLSEDPMETLSDHSFETEAHAAEADDTLDSIENEEVVFAESSDIEKESSQGLEDFEFKNDLDATATETEAEATEETETDKQIEAVEFIFASDLMATR